MIRWNARVRGGVDHWSSRVGFGAWRKAPRPGYSASDRPAGARSAGTAARSIPCDAERADSPDRDSTEDRHARARRERLDAESALRRVARVPALPRRDVRALVAHANGERHHRSKNKSECRARRFQQAESAREFQARRRGICLRHEMEATLLSAQRQRLLSCECAVGRHQPHLAHVSRTAEHRVVAAALPPQSQETTRPGPTGPLCDGCHSTNYDVQTKRVTEWNVGCERCHGPGSDHVASREKRPSSIHHV